MRAAREGGTASGGAGRPAPGAPDEERLADGAVPRPAAEDVVVRVLDGVEDAGAAQPGEPHLESQVAPHEVTEGPSALEQDPGAGDQLRHEGFELGGDSTRVEVPFLHSESVHEVAGGVDAALAQID